MLRALIWKEVREIWVIAAVGLAINFFFVLGNMGSPVGLPTVNQFIPFSPTDLSIPFVIYTSCIFAPLLGFWQFYHENSRGTNQFLLHRPISRAIMVITKICVGLTISSLIPFIPIITYALWAARPETHASPFYWSMTIPYFIGAATALILYLGGCLTEFFPKNSWTQGMVTFATIAAGLVIYTSNYAATRLSLILIFPAIIAIFGIGIYHKAKSRDWS